MRGPGAVENVLHGIDIVRAPVPLWTAEDRVTHELAHVRVVADAEHPTFLGRLLGFGGVLVLGDDVRTLVEQRLSSLALDDRVVPRERPDHVHLRIGVHRADTKRKGIDATDDLGNGERAGIADDVALGHQASHHPGKIAGLVHAAKVGGHVPRSLVPRTVFKVDVGEFLGHLEGGIHVAKRGRKDDVIALLSVLADHTSGIRPLGNALDVGCLDLVTQLLLENEPATVVLVGPSQVAGRANVDESHLEGLCGSLGRLLSGLLRGLFHDFFGGCLGRRWRGSRPTGGQHQRSNDHDAHQAP